MILKLKKFQTEKLEIWKKITIKKIRKMIKFWKKTITERYHRTHKFTSDDREYSIVW